MSARESRLRQHGKRLREQNQASINGHAQPCALPLCRRALCDNDRASGREYNRKKTKRLFTS